MKRPEKRWKFGAARRAKRARKEFAARYRAIRLEALEDRAMLASTLYLDFDAEAGGAPPPGHKPASFDSLYAQNSWAQSDTTARSMLDLGTLSSGKAKFLGDPDGNGRWNGDGTLNQTDALVAERKILQTVSYLFKDFDFDVKKTTDGWGVLEASEANHSEDTFVLFVGNEWSDDNFSTFGRAEPAPDHENNEWFGFVYAGNIARKLPGKIANADSWDYIWSVSSTIAHEFGHLLGLGHPGVLNSQNQFIKARQGASAAVQDPLSSLMSSGFKLAGSRFRDADYAQFPTTDYPSDIDVTLFNRNADQSTSLYYAEGQNQVEELEDSLLLDITVHQARGSASGYSETDQESLETLAAFDTPEFPVPAASLGTKGTTTAAQAVTRLVDGFNTFATQYIDDVSGTLNLNASALPIVGSQLATALGLTAQLQTAVAQLNGSGIATLDALKSSLEASGFNILASLTDQEYADLPTTSSADILRASRTYSLLSLAGQMGAQAGGLSGVQFLQSVGWTGNLDLLGSVGLHVGFGVDTQGFYLIPGLMLESQIQLTGALGATIGSAMTAAGHAGFDLSANTRLTTANADGRVRLSDLSADFQSQITRTLHGRAGFDVSFQAPIAGQQLQFDGNWAWDVDSNGFTLDTANSGLNASTLLDSLAEIAAAGVEKLRSGSTDLADAFDAIPWIGAPISNAISGALGSALTIDETLGSVRAGLEAQGFVFQAQATPEQILQSLINGTSLPSDLLQVTYSRSLPASLNVSASGQQTLSGMALTLSGSMQGSANAAVQLTLGVDSTSGVYVLEGGSIATTLSAGGALTGTATVSGLVNVTASGTGSISNISSTLTFSDGDSTSGEKHYLSGALSSFLQAPAVSVGSFALNDATIAAHIPALAGIGVPKFQVVVDAAYNLQTGAGTFTASEDAMLNGLAQWVFDGLDNLGSEAANLTQMVENLPLIGEDLASAVQTALQSGFEFEGAQTGVKQYLLSKGFTVGQVITAQQLFSGSVGNSPILQLNYSRTLQPDPIPVSIAGDLEAGPVKLTLDANLNISPTLTYSATVGLDLASGPFIVEGASVGIRVPLNGTLNGKASIGKLLQLQATAVADIDITGRAVLSDFDATANERIYLISSPTVDAIDVGEILQSPQATELSGDMGFDLQLTMNNPAAQLPVLNGILPSNLVWNAVVEYDPDTGLGSYEVKQDSTFNQAVALLTNTKQAMLNKALGTLSSNNPLPQSLRKILTDDLPVIGMSLVEIVGVPRSATLFLNPDEFAGDNEEELESGTPSGDHVLVNFDAASVNNVLNLLNGQTADLVSVDVRQSITVNKNIPIATVPLFSAFGVLNVTADVSVVAQLSLAFDATFGLDTEGFYVEASTSSDDFIAEVSGTVAGVIAGTARVVVIPFAELSTTLGLTATGGVLLTSPDDDKLRVNELGNPDNVGLGLVIDLGLSVDGELGFPDLNLSTSFNVLQRTFELYRANGSAPDIQSALAGVGGKFQREVEKMALKVALGPIALLQDLGQQAIDAIGDAVEDVGEMVGDAADAIGNELNNLANQTEQLLSNVQGQISDLYNSATEYLRDLGNAILTGVGIDDPGSIFGTGKVHNVSVPVRTSYSTSISNDTLFIVMDGSHSVAKEIFVSVAPDGRLVIDGPDFVREEEVGYRKYDCWDGCEKEYIYDDYTHYNRALFVMGGISRVDIVGTNVADRIIVDAKVLLPVRMRGQDGDDELIGGSGADTLEGGLGADRIFGNLGGDTLHGDGNNDLLVGGPGRDFLYGGTGNDILDEERDPDTAGNVMHGDDGDDVLRGSLGNDTMHGGIGADMLRGGPGADTLNGDIGNDYLEGGAGDDTLDGGDGNDKLLGDDPQGTLAGRDTMYGGPGDDTLVGGHDNDGLYGGLGADKLLGGPGDDLLLGALPNNYDAPGDLADDLNGGPGNDSMYGGLGNDRLAGGADNDTLEGGPGNDLLNGEGGINTVRGGSGDDKLIGLAGEDTLYGDGGNDLITGKIARGGSGDDTIAGTAGDDQLYGEGDNDRLAGLAGNDTVDGGSGNDTITGGEGDDTLIGVSGNDTFLFTPTVPLGWDRVNDSAGVDTLDFSGVKTTAAAAVRDLTIKLNTTAQQIVNSNLKLSIVSAANIENVIAGDGNDLIIGNALNNTFTGGLGDDVYQYNTSATAGTDTIHDAGGIDEITFAGSLANVSVNLQSTAVQIVYSGMMLKLGSGASIENLTGGSANDTLLGNSLNNRIIGGPGNDLLSGAAGDDLYPFNTTVNLGQDEIQDTAGVDTVDFTGSTTAVTLDLGITTLQSVNARHQLKLASGASIENAIGGSGNDSFTANSLSNWLVGAAGNDNYVFDASSAAGSDRVTDSAGVDHLDFTATTLPISVDLGVGAQQTVNANLKLTLDNGASLEWLTGGKNNDLLVGNAVGNRLIGGPGHDTLRGNGGNDVYSFNASSPLGTDRIEELSGIDVLDFSLSTSGVTVNMASTTLQVVNSNLSLILTSATAIENFTGGSGDDVVTGNSLSNILNGGPGNDLYKFPTNTPLGQDEIRDASGIDGVDFSASTIPVTINLALATPQVINSNLTLTLPSTVAMENAFGGSNNDAITGNASNNDLVGGAGSDTYFFNANLPLGFDRVDDSAGIDLLDFSVGTLAVNVDLGLTGVQQVNANHSMQLLSATSIEHVRTGSGSDRITGNGLDNTLNGGAGNDTYLFDADSPLGVDRLEDASGGDTVNWSATSAAIVVDLGIAATQTIHANHQLTLVATAFEHAVGGSGNDRLFGNGVGNSLTGGPGDDTLVGRGGDDSLFGSGDNDSLSGDAGNDLLNGGSEDDTYFFNTTTQLNVDQVTDGSGIDLLDFTGSTLDLTLDLGITTQQTVNANLALILVSGNAIENVIGGAGNDRILGNALNNDLKGMLGNDSLSGAGGNDRLTGGGGSDSLIGGIGSDTYLFAAAIGTEADTLEERRLEYDPQATGFTNDVLDFTLLPASVGVTVDLQVGNAVFATHTGRTVRSISDTSQVEIEEVQGGAGSDSLTATSDWRIPRLLVGNGGSDTITLSWNVSGEWIEARGGAGTDTVSLVGKYLGDYSISEFETIDVSQLSPNTFGSSDEATRAKLVVTPTTKLKRELGELVPLTAGWDITRAISGIGDQDDYQFQLTTATRLWFDSRTNSADVQWHFTGPTGAIWNSTFNSGDHDLGLLQPGIYVLTVSGVGDKTGGYDFRLLDLAAADVLPLNTVIRQPLTPANQTQVFKIAGIAGNTIYIDLLNVHATSQEGEFSTWKLLDPYGQVVKTDEWLNVDLGRHTFEHTGTYTLVVEGSIQATGITSAEFKVHATTDDFGTITLGTPVSGTISQVGQFDRQTFTLASPARLWFDNRTLSNDLQWELTVPTGTVQWSAQFGSDDFDLGLLQPGTYTLTVSGRSDGTGDYSFNLQSLANATPLPLGTDRSITLSPATQTLFYRFDGTAGNALYVDSLAYNAAAGSIATWRLIDPYGQQLSYQWLYDDIGRVELHHTGTYTLVIDGMIYSTGTTTATFNVRASVDDLGPLTIGTPVSSSISQVGQWDRRTFTLSTPTRLWFDSRTNSGSLQWQLVGPMGVGTSSVVQSWISFNADDRDLGLLQPGTYELTVANADATGNYAFNLVDLASATLINAGNSSAPTGQIVTGTLVPPSKTDFYRFNATAGDRLSLDVVNATESTAITWSLLDPQGQRLANDFFGDVNNIAINTTGTYTLVVMGAVTQSGASLPYSFRVNFASQTTPPATPGTLLTLGTAVNADIGTSTEIDRYRFTLATPTRLWFDSRTNTSNIWWKLSGPSGVVQDWLTFDWDDQNIGQLQPGTYSLQVSGVNGATESYSFNLLNLASATSLTLGTARTVTLNPANQAQLFKFDGTAGSTVYFDNLSFSSDSGEWSASWVLLDPYGQQVDNEALHSDLGRQTLAHTGTYTLVVQGYYTASGITTATFNVRTVTDDSAAFAFGTPVSGNISQIGQWDKYSVSLSSPTRLWFDNRINSDQRQWRLTGPTGAIQDWLTFDWDDRDVGLLQPGSYTLTVSGAGDAVGAYAFDLLDMTNAPALTLGTTQNVTLNPAKKALVYKIAGTANNSIYIDNLSYNSSDGSGDSSTWHLVDPYGGVVGSYSMINQDLGRFTLKHSGNYTLVVEGNYNATGTTTASFVVRAVADDAAALVLGTPVNGSISQVGQWDRFSFTLATPTRLWFDNRLDTANKMWRLSGPTGELQSWLTFDWDDRDLGILQPGSYAMTVSGVGDATGSYAFNLLNQSNATALTLGTARTATLNPVSQTQLFKFDDTAGSIVYLNSLSFNSSDGSDGSSNWMLLDPYGQQLNSTVWSFDIGRVTLPHSGTYTVIVQGSLYATGTTTAVFNVHPVTDDLSEIVPGTSVSGDISQIGQWDSRTFTLTSPTRLWLDIRTNASNLQWQLTGPTGTIQSALTFDWDDRDLGQLLPGTYTLSVYGVDDATGSYAFNLSDLSAATPINTGSLATPLGPTVTGTLTLPNETDLYRFNATAGNRLTLDILSTPPSNVTWILLDPYGSTVVNSTFADVNSVLMNSTGTYTLLVLGAYYRAGPATNYSFRVNYVSHTAPPAPTGTALTLGTAVNANIGAAGEMDNYLFSLSTPSRLWFDTRTNRAGLQWQLTGPTGVVQSWQSFDWDDRDLGLLQPGNYLLQIKGVVATYSIQLSDLAAATPITFGSTVNVTLNPASQTQFFKFAGRAGSSIYIDSQNLHSANGSGDFSAWSLVDPYGRNVYEDFLHSDMGYHTIEHTGDYTVIVKGPVTATGMTTAAFAVYAVDASAAPTMDLGANVNYSPSGADVSVTPAATLFDADSSDFKNSQLTVQLTANAEANDRLQIRGQANTAAWNVVTQVTDSATNSGSLFIMVPGATGLQAVHLGVFSGGMGQRPLVLRFTANATASRIQKVMRAITFSSVSATPSTLARTVSFQLTDGDGAISALVTKTIALS